MASPEVTVPVYLSVTENGTTNVTEEYWTLPYASDIDDIDNQFNAAVDQQIASLEYPTYVIRISAYYSLLIVHY